MYKSDLDAKNKKKWNGVRSIIEVKREIVKKGKPSEEIAYFISDLSHKMGARYFCEGVRSHWQIETFHYIKDVTFMEDKWKVRLKNAPANYSLLRNVSINIFRQHGFECMQAMVEKCANNVPFMMSLF